MHKNILLVQPQWPIPSRKKHSVHHKYFPTGLLKLSSLFKNQGHRVEFTIGVNRPAVEPDEIYITSLFTYWLKYITDTATGYRQMFNNAKIIVGGPCITLLNHFHPAQLDFIRNFVRVDELFVGLYKEAEKYLPDLSLVPDSPYHTLHVTRGCKRNCAPCGVWVVENKFTWKETVQHEILRNAVALYDNNLLFHPGIEDILGELAATKVNGKVVRYESQSGFDARVLIQKPHLAKMIKQARFIRPRVAFDNGLDEYEVVEEAVHLLTEAGYPRKEIMVFVLYNYNEPFTVLEKKRQLLRKLGVQISDCRYRPLDSLEDNYKPGKIQQPGEYYVHPNWTDWEIKEYRRRVRGQNIMARFMGKGRAINPEYFRTNNVPEVIINEFIA